ncbi:MAG: divalent-cation tolerance protein CutA, partial [Holophaga sp.]|nr:divalent-cation tolerance protein CutA [Holophaga sp.]
TCLNGKGAVLSKTDACAILTTCGSEETALTIAAALVDQGYAACVSILPGIKSYYYYQGGTHLDEEVMLIIKSTQNQFQAISQTIAELHTYEVPEILMFPAEAGSAPFLQWLQKSTPSQS